jgi:hypothetical protein
MAQTTAQLPTLGPRRVADRRTVVLVSAVATLVGALWVGVAFG